MFSKAYRLLNGRPFSVDNLKIDKFLDKIKAIKILTLNNYIQLPKNEKLQKITADDFRNSLINWIRLCDEKEIENELSAFESNLLMLVSDYFVSEKPMKKKLLRIKQSVRDKYKKYSRLKNQLLNEPGILVDGGEKSIQLERGKEFKVHKLNVTAGTENFSFHILLFLYVKKIHELTNYSIINICTLISHTFEYFSLLPSNYLVFNYAYSLRNKFYRLRNHKEKILEILKLEFELYRLKVDLNPQDLSALLEWFDLELE